MGKKGKNAAAAAAASSGNNSQDLAPRDKGLFQQLVKAYDDKQYKKAIKSADQILSRNPQHGETLAMKGLVLTVQKNTDEGKKLIKRGLACNIKSPTCWHVYGIVYRTEGNYEEAVKCFQQAHKLEADNISVLKDLALLQAQQRNFDAYQEMRRQLLVKKPGQPQNWVSFAVGCHLAGRHTKAIEIIDGFLQSSGEDSTLSRYQISEVLLYKNTVIQEAGDLERALTHLDEIKAKCTDMISWNEYRATLLVKLGRERDAVPFLEELVDLNPENHDYLRRLLSAKGLTAPFTAEDVGELDQLFGALAGKHQRCSAIRRLPLEYLSGSSFERRVASYMVRLLRRGAPSLFQDLSSLYVDPDKMSTIEKLILSFISELKSSGRFPAPVETREEKESGGCLLFSLYFAANHYLWKHKHQTSDTQKDLETALEYTNEAVTHTPTCVDLYVMKARIFKAMGDFETAFELMDYARNMDLADRYLNTKCVRYAHRAGHLKEADEIVMLFLREGDSVISLSDMQVMWYEVSAGAAFSRLGDHARALKQLHWVDKHFTTFRQDEFDFHTYCMRKTTLRAYVDLIRWEDRVHDNQFFQRAAVLTVKEYLRMHEESLDADLSARLAAGESTDKLNDEEKRRSKHLSYRQAARSAAEESVKKSRAEAKAAQSHFKNKGGEVDKDPYGDKIAETKTPLDDATPFAEKLQSFCGDRIDTHVVAARLYLAKRRPLLTLRALKRGAAIDSSNPDLLVEAARFLHWIDSIPQDQQLPDVVAQVIAEERKSDFFGGHGAAAFCDAFVKAHSDSFPHRFAQARAVAATSDGVAKIVPSLLQSVGGKKAASGVSVEICSDVLAFLREVASDGEVAEFVSACAKRFPHARLFMADDLFESRRRQRIIHDGELTHIKGSTALASLIEETNNQSSSSSSSSSSSDDKGGQKQQGRKGSKKKKGRK